MHARSEGAVLSVRGWRRLRLTGETDVWINVITCHRAASLSLVVFEIRKFTRSLLIMSYDEKTLEAGCTPDSPIAPSKSTTFDDSTYDVEAATHSTAPNRRKLPVSSN
jgi:hypothetical protein